MNSEVVNYIGYLLIAFLGIGTASLVVLVKKYRDYASAEAGKINDERTRTLVNQTLDNLENLIVDTVDVINITIADQIKEAIKDGRADKTELQKLSQVALDKIMSKLGDNAKVVLSDEIGDLEEYIKDKIELAVEALKVDKVN